MKRNFIKTDAIFKCIITLKSGMHRVIRMTIEKVAKLNATIRMQKEVGLLTKRYEDFMQQMELTAGDILSCRIINERTGRELLCL